MRTSLKLTLATAALAGMTLAATPPAAADGPSPGGGSGASKCSKFKKGSKEWKECMGQHSEGLEDAYALGYWLAKTGAYEEALAVLKGTGTESDPRVLTMIGYATRHLGRVEEALGYYDRALALNAAMTNTRQYLGEAYLQLGEPDSARAQLSEIGARCGTGCEDYRKLADAIAAFDAGTFKG
jgi:tetratricopeptide (TPR) repeat protein